MACDGASFPAQALGTLSLTIFLESQQFPPTMCGPWETPSLVAASSISHSSSAGMGPIGTSFHQELSESTEAKGEIAQLLGTTPEEEINEDEVPSRDRASR